MKYLFVLLAMAAMVFAANDGCTESYVSMNPAPSTDDISISVVNDWSLPSGTKALGLDIFEAPGALFVLGTDNTNGYIQAWDAGSPVGTLPLAAGNPNCFGVAWNNSPDTDTYYTNDWGNSNLFYTEDFGSTWTTTPNPAGSNGRGMDFDGTNYWSTNGTGGGLWRFNPGVGQSNLSTPEISTQPSGLAAFPYMGDVGIAVTCYQTMNIYFYRWDGANFTYLGMAACPGSPYRSYGLAYSEATDHLYWSYSPTSGTYSIAELSFTITSLSRDTWAGIKTAF